MTQTLYKKNIETGTNIPILRGTLRDSYDDPMIPQSLRRLDLSMDGLRKHVPFAQEEEHSPFAFREDHSTHASTWFCGVKSLLKRWFFGIQTIESMVLGIKWGLEFTPRIGPFTTPAVATGKNARSVSVLFVPS